MNRIDFVLSLTEEKKIDLDSLESVKFEDGRYVGFCYLYNYSNLGEDYILCPSGELHNFSSIEKRLEKLEVGNKYQIEAHRAWEFLMLNQCIHHGVYNECVEETEEETTEEDKSYELYEQETFL